MGDATQASTDPLSAPAAPLSNASRMSENPARDAGPKGTPVAATKRRSGVRDDDDVAEVGHWQRDKLALLTEYIKISRSARTKYLAPSEATYVDLFRGSGRARVEGTNEEIDGSAVAAWRAAKECGVPFSRVFIADASASKVGACETRLR
jgi:hypothetical protein